jgi:hypothetical protein
LVDPHLGVGTRSKPLSAASRGSYFPIDVPSAQLHPYTSGGWSLPKNPPVPVQVFVVTAGDLESHSFDSELVLPASAAPPPNLYSQTATGWTVYVPDFANGGACPGLGEALPRAIADRLNTRPQDWHGVICPAPKATARLNFGPDEHLESSSIPVTRTESNTGNPVWEIEPGFLGVAYQSGSFGGFWVDVADGEIASAAQRDLLFAGVLYGLAGGLAASWLVPGVSWLVTRSSRTASATRE